MQKRKIAFFLISLILLLTVYLFRYPLFLWFQCSRLTGLSCGKANCMNRIWAHRVNSTERYKILKDKFSGFELDIIYTGTEKGFAVLHPPVAIVGDTLTLDAYLSQADLLNDRFWFDTRFLSSSNMEKGLVELNRLTKKYPQIKDCILEIYSLPAAQLLAENGYTVSFNVSEKWLNDLSGNNSLRDSVTLSLEHVKYVSQDAAYLPRVKKLFPGKKILTWHLAIKDFLNRKPLKALLADQQVELVLVNIKTPYFQ